VSVFVDCTDYGVYYNGGVENMMNGIKLSSLFLIVLLVGCQITPEVETDAISNKAANTELQKKSDLLKQEIESEVTDELEESTLADINYEKDSNPSFMKAFSASDMEELVISSDAQNQWMKIEGNFVVRGNGEGKVLVENLSKKDLRELIKKAKENSENNDIKTLMELKFSEAKIYKPENNMMKKLEKENKKALHRSRDISWATIENGINILSRNSGYSLFVTKDNKGAYFTDINSILHVDFKSGQINKVTKDKTGEYSLADARSVENNESLTWASNPVFNQSSDYVLYSSNRRTYFENSDEGTSYDAHVVDVKNNEDRLLKTEANPIGIYDTCAVLLENNEKLYLYDIKSKSEVVLSNNIMIAMVIDNFVFYRIKDDMKNILIYDMSTGKEYALQYPENSYVNLNFNISPDRSMVMCSFYPDRKENVIDIVVFNLENQKVLQMNFPNKTSDDLWLGGWLNNTEITVHYRNELDEYTMIGTIENATESIYGLKTIRK